MIACGGTGGHLSPGIALAEELVSRGWQCELLISGKQVDSRLVKKYSSFDYTIIAGSGLGWSPVKLAKFLYNLVSGVAKTAMRVRRERPSVMIGFGGFLSASALLGAYLAGAPTAIHEANRVPGRVTRLVGFFVNRLYLPPGTSVKSAHSSRIRQVGMPVRREIRSLPKPKAKRQLGFDPSQKLLLVFGGSQGARALNEWVKSSLDSLAQEEIQVFCLMGMASGSDSEMIFKSRGGTEVKAVFRAFCDQMGSALSAADLVVSRAGAGSISEIIRCRTPSILVPYPYAADNHQYYNALHLEMQGGGMMIDESYLANLMEEVKDAIYNDWLLQRFRSNLEKMDRVSVQSVMARDLELMLREIETGGGTHLAGVRQAKGGS